MSNDVQNNNISQCTEHFSNISLIKTKQQILFRKVLLIIIATVFNLLTMTHSYQKNIKI